jgi:SAM-dependent methyltransferase
MNELTEIANNCRTDKGTTIHEGHNYTEFYYDYFKKLKDTKEKVYILEIGIYHGGSLKMYNEFFEHNCEIYAIDINLSLNYYEDENVHLYQMDINNKSKLNEFLEEVKDISFDFILDDASHRFSDQYNSLFSLYHKLKPNGTFILEDFHTWTWENEQDSPLRF